MNRFLQGLGKGISDYGRAIRFINKEGLAWFYLVPIIINIGLFIGGFSAIGELTDFLKDEALQATTLNESDSWLGETAAWLLTGTIWLILKIAFFFMFAYLGGYIVVIVMSPALAFLSEKTEKILTGHDYPFDIQQLMRDITRGILLALRNMFLEILIIIGFFIIGLFPVIGWLISLVSPIALLLVSAYFYGFSFTDYVNERQRLSVKQSVQLMKKNRGLITGNGLPFALTLLIPIIGVTISGFIAIISTVSAVISIKDQLEDLPKQTQLNA